MKKNSTPEIKVGYLSTVYHTSLLLMGTGWLEERLNIKTGWRLFGAGPAVIQAFAKGEIDLGYTGLPPVIIGIDKGIAIKCVGGGHVEGTVLIARGDFKSIEELREINAVFQQFRGKIIGTPQMGSIHDVIIRSCIKESSLEDEIAVKNYNWTDFVLDAIVDGEIHAAAGTPALAVAASRACDAKIIIPAHKLWANNPSCGIIATRRLIENSPDLLEEFLKLHEEASNFIRMHPARAAKIVSGMVELVDEDFVLKAYEISPKYCAGISEEFIAATLAFVPVLYKLGYLKKLLTQEDIFDLRFIKK
ncbi:MAG: ABC transporter substrate-binding protein, partial [Euryarchaeota archaeon]|nr:ABC transporter substrate-binding protein [Euryarchaeota archaeon]